jgi:molybdopterin molybdotransferase
VIEVRVVRRPRVAIVSTGNELCEDPKSLQLGQIMNSNGPLLCQLSTAHGLEAVAHLHVADDLQQTCWALEHALESADMVVVTGGVSVGDSDLVPEAFGALRLELHVARLAIKPGRPTMIATRNHQPVFGLPGNPVAAYLAFYLLVLRAAARLTLSLPPMRVFSLESSSAFERRSADRMEFLPARLTEDGRVAWLEFHGSAHLAALTKADGFAVMPPGTRVVEAGERVSFWSWGSLC